MVNHAVAGIAAFIVGSATLLATAEGHPLEWTGVIHRVTERSHGVCYRNGRLLHVTLAPGLHMKWPSIITTCANIATTQRTDIYKQLECWPKDSDQKIFFPEIRVKHILPQANVIATLSQYGQEYEDTVIEAEVGNYVNTMCATMSVDELLIDSWATLEPTLLTHMAEHAKPAGINVIDVNIPRKPEPPLQHKARYEARARTKKEFELGKEAEAKQKNARAAAKSAALQRTEVKHIETEALQKRQKVEDETRLATAKAEAAAIKVRADAKLYAAQKEAEGHAKLLTENYLKFRSIMSLENSNASKIIVPMDAKVFVSSGNAAATAAAASASSTNM